MPVALIQADATTLADQPAWRCDLEKIYSEAEPMRRTLDGEPMDAPLFIDTALGLQGNWFAGALFNDHLIGAVLVSMSDEEWQLRHLCVREVTRRRGVGTRLMALVASMAREQGLRVRVPDTGLTMADQKLVCRLGYVPCPERGFILE
ncbi:acetyl-CoA sensor PanZ family protein [Marinospirillum alkaliphilum]|uniref:Acetyltransferase (GNAT) domain-containing protein n=1 Tax=Marinospirillum alkaliphilum DSM 21637 TaxID=1122209 RepID=A0A1K1W7F2_9GAMM|nr:acetyl-CoA sensor PanZ family protein [Marinospirillum alkaliphilum]SFX33286.1 Acetyltransferase (GNAT) domain-containing protein [Marinospirillum alkaliphilum DSM 21637]